MALYLDQMKVGTIVDRVSEWGDDGKERPLMDMPRGVIVRVTGDADQEHVQELFVCFGPREEIQDRHGKTFMKQDKKVTLHGTTVPCMAVKPAELHEVYPFDTLHAKESWRRLFKIPTNVGFIQENRRAKGSGKRRLVDELALTQGPGDGPVKDDPMTIRDLPEAEA